MSFSLFWYVCFSSLMPMSSFRNWLCGECMCSEGSAMYTFPRLLSFVFITVALQ